MNRFFWQQANDDLFGFYYGPLANTVWTKYRESDSPLTTSDVETLNRSGIYAVINGHQNQVSGQQLTLRCGLLHVECVVTLDPNSRIKEGLPGTGAGSTTICPEGQIIAISVDYPFAKILDPYSFLRTPALNRSCTSSANTELRQEADRLRT